MEKCEGKKKNVEHLSDGALSKPIKYIKSILDSSPLFRVGHNKYDKVLSATQQIRMDKAQELFCNCNEGRSFTPCSLWLSPIVDICIKNDKESVGCI